MSPTDAPSPELGRARALGAALARRIVEAPDDAVAHGRSTLDRMRSADSDGHARALLDAWDRLLDGPADQIVAVLTDPDQDQLASSSPFPGLLHPGERWEILRAERRTGSAEPSPEGVELLLGRVPRLSAGPQPERAGKRESGV